MIQINKINDFIKKSNERPFYYFKPSEKANETEIKELEAIASMSIPEDLKTFYLSIGEMRLDYNNEHLYTTYSLDIYSPKELIDKLKETNKWNKLYSCGIIDMILFSWDNNRPEFKEYMKSEDIAYLNEHYKSFGCYTTSTESEHVYLYFDIEDNFSTISYDQDMFDALVNNYLNPMLKQSPASKTLDECLLETMQVIDEGLGD